VHDAIEEVLLLQTEYSARNTDAMQRRGQIIRTEFRHELEEILPSLSASSRIDDLNVQGKDGTGQKTEIPWTRIYSDSRSPRPTSGWYLVFLFSAGGDRVYLSLNQGTTRWDGVEFRPQPESDLKSRTSWARSVLTANGPLPAGWKPDIDLDNTVSKLGTYYRLGNVVAIEYLLDSIPSDDQLEQDLLKGAGMLGEIYRAADEGLYVPGDSPDIADIETALQIIADPRNASSRGGLRLTAAERRVIEEHAVGVAKRHLESESWGFAVEDVGKIESYDLHAVKDGAVIKVEVKGTTSDGSEVVLTRNEVLLHQSEFPANALAIVRNIKLRRSKDSPPSASGGELILAMPWALKDDSLAPIAYRYTTSLFTS
jgi:hypothetical protein